MREFFEAFPSSSSRLAMAPVFADHVVDVALSGDMLTRVRIPAGAKFVLFSFDGDVRIKLGLETTSFDLPLATGINGSGSELNAAARKIPAFMPDDVTAPTHIVLRAPAACTGSLSFYG